VLPVEHRNLDLIAVDAASGIRRTLICGNSAHASQLTLISERVRLRRDQAGFAPAGAAAAANADGVVRLWARI
jgi:hypothetical protein